MWLGELIMGGGNVISQIFYRSSRIMSFSVFAGRPPVPGIIKQRLGRDLLGDGWWSWHSCLSLTCSGPLLGMFAKQ